MSITREQVQDLQPGDVVELTDERWPAGTVVRGALYLDAETLHVAGEYVRHYDGKPAFAGKYQSLTVVSRAPRPLYVNHPRTEPVPGDVVRDADDEVGTDVWFHDIDGDWTCRGGGAIYDRDDLPARLRLLVDGETGQVVQ